MCKRVFFAMIVMILACVNFLFAQDQYLPFMAGENWTCNQGNSSPVSHKDNSSTEYGFDFITDNCKHKPIGSNVLGPMSLDFRDERYIIRVDKKFGNIIHFDLAVFFQRCG